MVVFKKMKSERLSKETEGISKIVWVDIYWNHRPGNVINNIVNRLSVRLRLGAQRKIVGSSSFCGEPPLSAAWWRRPSALHQHEGLLAVHQPGWYYSTSSQGAYVLSPCLAHTNPHTHRALLVITHEEDDYSLIPGACIYHIYIPYIYYIAVIE